jgi:hypothetical protein
VITLKASTVKFATFLFIVMGCCAVSAMADTITLTGTGTNFSDGVYVVPYYISVQSGTSGASYEVLCDSYFNAVNVPETWTGTVNTAATLDATKFGSVAGINATRDYTEAAWLMTLWEHNPTYSVAAAVNFAIWELFAPAYQQPLSTFEQQQLQAGLLDTGAQSYLDSANTWFANADASSRAMYLDTLLIFTPTPTSNTDTGPQEYLTVVPEPATLALFACGLGLIAIVLRIRQRRGPVKSNRLAR